MNRFILYTVPSFDKNLTHCKNALTRIQHQGERDAWDLKEGSVLGELM